MKRRRVPKQRALRDDPLATLASLEGFYECPESSDGELLGPLVGYAGRYGPEQLQWVGKVYANFAKAEPYWWVLDAWAERMQDQLQALDADVFLGMPIGGLFTAGAFARVVGCRQEFAEKETLAMKTATEREKTRLVLGRHEIHEGDRVVVAEDVTNNFSTTQQAISLVNTAGGKVVAIACLLNRSSQKSYDAGGGRFVPVVSLVARVIEQYEQDDPAVASDVAAGNVVWKPKNDWARLARAMQRRRLIGGSEQKLVR
jgi:orotate phosphoribosyltransferase